MRVAGIVLAAGAGRRMGGNKMRLRLAGESLVRRAARMVTEAGLSPTVVVLGHEADLTALELDGLPVEVVVNPDFTGPTSGSLHLALNRISPDIDAAIIVLADMVYVTEDMVRALPDLAVGSGAPLVVSRYGEVNAPPLFFTRPLFSELLAWTGEGCGKAVVQRHRDEAAYIDWPVEKLTDLDTPEDYARARAVVERSA